MGARPRGAGSPKTDDCHNVGIGRFAEIEAEQKSAGQGHLGRLPFPSRLARLSCTPRVLQDRRRQRSMHPKSAFQSVLVLVSAGALALAASSWQKEDPSQWTSEDLYQILNNSPWSKTVKVTLATQTLRQDEGMGSGRGGGPWGEGMPGGGMGRGGGMGGMGRGRRGGGYPRSEAPTTVTVQWESALPVRLAQAKLAGAAPDSASKPSKEYVIAVIGLPKSGLGPEWSGNSGDDSDNTKLADHLKVITVLSIGGERLNPTKVELDQGRDARTVFHFEKSEPVTLHDKDPEFRIATSSMEIKKKFPLKDMQYRGNLQL